MAKKVIKIDSDIKADWLKTEETRKLATEIYKALSKEYAGDGAKAEEE